METMEELLEKTKLKAAMKNNGLTENLKDIVLYHGSKGGIEGDIEPSSRARCDFGRGFYMGTDAMQAKSLVSGDDVPYIYKLQFRLSELDPQNVLVLNEDKWLYTILSHRRDIDMFNQLEVSRQYREMISKYDVVIGKIADDKMRQAMSAFTDNAITDVGLRYCLQSVDWTQIVAKTPEACSKIDILEERKLKGQELQQAIDYSQEMQKKSIGIVNIARMEYSDIGKRLSDIIKEERNREKGIER